LNLPRSLKSDFGSSSNSGIVSMDLFSEVYSFDEGTVVGIPHGESFAVAFKSDAVNWEISNESKTILGFKCFKAIVAYKESYDRQFARSHTEIWFAPSINKRGGPIVYTNVPGLILEVKLKDVVITASKIKTSKTNGFEKTKKQIISEKQFHKQAAEIGAAIEKRMKN
jgi:GLPGLI family protein